MKNQNQLDVNCQPRQSELAVDSIIKNLFKQNRARGGNFPETFVTLLVIQFPGGSPGVRMERQSFILRVLRAIRRHLHFMGGLGHWRPGVRWRELTKKSVSAQRRTDMKLSETNLCLTSVAVAIKICSLA